MAIQLSEAVRNARINAIESTIGATAILKIRTGAQPGSCTASDSGSTLASITLPADWMAAAASGAAAMTGTWADASADGTGTADHFRVYNAAGTACGLQGSVGTGAEDLVVDNDSFAAGQSFSITSFTLTDGNG